MVKNRIMTAYDKKLCNVFFAVVADDFAEVLVNLANTMALIYSNFFPLFPISPLSGLFFFFLFHSCAKSTL